MVTLYLYFRRAGLNATRAFKAARYTEREGVTSLDVVTWVANQFRIMTEHQLSAY